jgi:hypothetical protein
MKNLLFKILVLSAFLGFSFAFALDIDKSSYIDYKIPQHVRVEAKLPKSFPESVELNYKKTIFDKNFVYYAFITKADGYWFMLNLIKKSEFLYYYLVIVKMDDSSTAYGGNQTNPDFSLPASDLKGRIHKKHFLFF